MTTHFCEYLMDLDWSGIDVSPLWLGGQTTVPRPRSAQYEPAVPTPPPRGGSGGLASPHTGSYDVRPGHWSGGRQPGVEYQAN